MLFALGALQFDVVPFNTHETHRESGADFAPHDVVGAQRPREFVGESDERFIFHGRLFPHKFGGLTELDMLDQMRASGEPQILVRGDGRNLGWFVVEHVRERSEFLDAFGVGRQIIYEMTLVKSPAGTPASALGTLLRLLG